MPFENLGNPADAYFADGVTDEIAGQLARLPGVLVVGRAGLQRPRAADGSARDIARKVGAAWVLTGSVRWARDAGAANGTVDGATRVRITPALVNVETGRLAWSDPLEERLADVFRAQGAVAERVAAALSVRLSGGQRASLQRAESNNPAARDAQLLGRSLLRQRGLANLRRAETQFARAVALDSSYARAWAGLAEVILVRPIYGDTTETIDAFAARAEVAARRAVALDSTLPEVRLAVARTLLRQFRLREALAADDRVLALDSSNGSAWVVRAEALMGLGRVADAIAAAQRAVEIDPVSSQFQNALAGANIALDRPDSALAASERAMTLEPDDPMLRATRAGALRGAGRYADAVTLCRSGGAVPTALCPFLGDPRALTPATRAGALAMLNATAGVRASNWQTIATTVYAQLGQLDSAFARLRIAVEVRDDILLYSLATLERGPMGRDPRWEAIVGSRRRR